MQTDRHQDRTKDGAARTSQGRAGGTGGSASEASPKGGLKIERYFTDGKVRPFDTLEWELRSAAIANE